MRMVKELSLGRMACPLILGLYLVSFFLPVYGNSPGWQTFILACPLLLWGMAFAGLAWLANPCLWAGVYYLGRGRGSAAWRLGVLGLGLGLSSPLLWATMTEGKVFLQEGYWVWLASLAVLIPAGLWADNRPATREGHYEDIYTLAAYRLLEHGASLPGDGR
jgi:hypothetical protein